MQEEVENRTLTLVVNGTKFTERLFKAAICKYLAHRKPYFGHEGGIACGKTATSSMVMLYSTPSNL